MRLLSSSEKESCADRACANDGHESPPPLRLRRPYTDRSSCQPLSKRNLAIDSTVRRGHCHYRRRLRLFRRSRPNRRAPKRLVCMISVWSQGRQVSWAGSFQRTPTLAKPNDKPCVFGRITSHCHHLIAVRVQITDATTRCSAKATQRRPEMWQRQRRRRLSGWRARS
jgi:hypothetical protein